MAGIVGGVAALAGGVLGAGAARSAAGTQAASLQQALDFQKQVYGTAQGNLNPFIGQGTNALAALSQLYGLPAPAGSSLPAGNALTAYNNFTQTPFYQFPLSQGVQALNASGAARGLTLSGGQAKALQAYGQGYASQNFNSYIGALANLANLGQGSAAALAGYGNQGAATNLQGSTALGNAQASGIIGGQNQINNALGAIPQILGLSGGTGSTYGNQAGGGLSNLVNGTSNIFNGYTWGGMPGSAMLGNLSAQAAGNVSGGAAGQ